MDGAVNSDGLFRDQSFVVSARLSPDQYFAVMTAHFSQGRIGMGTGVRSIITGIGSHRMVTTGMWVMPMPVMVTTERY